MPVFDITAPDGTHYEVIGPDGSTEEQALQQVQAQHGTAPNPAAAPYNARQPTMMQTLGASPVGRFAHDFALPMIEAPARLLAKIDPTGGAVEPAAARAEGTYQEAVAAQRNRPGYTAARQRADAVQSGLPNGLGDQFISSLTPALAGIAGLPGGINASNAAADAQTAARDTYAKQNPKSSFLANVAGGFMAVPEGGQARLPNIPPKQVAPTIGQLKTDASAAYKSAENSGVIASAPSYGQMASDLEQKLAALGIDATLHPNATAAAKRVLENQGQDMSLQALETQRRIAGHAIDASTMNKADRRMAHIIQDHIDDYVGNLQPADLVAGANPQQAAADLNNARDLYSRSAKASTIQGLIDKAGVNGSNYTASGYENSLRVQFRKLANNDRAMRRFSSPEQDAIKRVATGGSAASLNNGLRYLGKFSPQGFFPAVTEMGAVATLGAPALAIPAAGFAGRVGATAMTKAAAKRAVDLAALGNTATAIPATVPLQLPRLTPRSAVPYGILASGLPRSQ